MTTQDTQVYNSYNPYNLELEFKSFLIHLNKSRSTVKNYLSDFRHFIGWLISSKSDQNEAPIDSKENLINHITDISIHHYRDYLIMADLPDKTVNRRLSTVRIFCSFCVQQKWLPVNPSAHITNVGLSENKTHTTNPTQPTTLEQEFEQYKSEQEDSNNTDSDNVSDIQDFIDFIKNE